MQKSVRSQILEAAISDLAVSGTEFFDLSALCAHLHIARSLINHHFGDRSGLISEATVVAYERYVAELRDAAVVHETPEDRLEAWMNAQHQWFRRNRGLAVILQMGHPIYGATIRQKFGERLNDMFRFNMTVLGILVRDVRRGEVSALDFEIDTAPYEEVVLGDKNLIFEGALVGLSSMGASVWMAGQALPTRDLDEMQFEDLVVQSHSKWLVESLRSVRVV